MGGASGIRSNFMGMDTSFILMDVEEAFDLRLSEQECGDVRTVGDLHALVAEKLHVGGEGPCLSMKTFHLLRRNLIATCGLGREEIRVDSQLMFLLPGRGRKAMWERLEHRMGLKLPELTLPTVLASVMLASAAGACIAIPVGVISGMSVTAALITVLLICGKHYAMHWLASPWANRFHVGIRTVGDLTKAILRRNFGTLSRQARHAGDLEIWHAVRAIVAQNMGISEEEIKPDSRFVEDLGAT